MLFGAGNKIFMPHEAGYDLRFRLQDLYESGEIKLPAFPGLVGDYIAAEGPHVSYGLVRAPAEAPSGFRPCEQETQFKNTKPHSLHVPFVLFRFHRCFRGCAPSTLGVGESFKFQALFRNWWRKVSQTFQMLLTSWLENGLGTYQEKSRKKSPPSLQKKYT